MSSQVAILRKSRKTVGTVIGQIVLLIITVIQVYPLIWLAFFSLKSNKEIFSGDVAGLPKAWLWSNYSTALNAGHVLTFFINSVIVTGATILLTLILSAMAAYAITRMRWKLSGPTMTLILLGMMVPIHAALLPLFIQLSRLHLRDSYWALIIPYVAFAIPMAVFILSSFLKGIPYEMEEAAVIDGCGIYRTFFIIILPLIKSALATVAIFTYLSSWNELMFAVTFIDSQKFQTLTVGVMSMVGTYITQWGVVGAGLMVTTIPTVILYLSLSKQVQESIVAGAVKG